MKGGANKVKWGRHVGTTPPPSYAAKKENPPSLGGLNKIKLGQCDIHHTTPLIENPPHRWGGVIQLEQGGM